MMLRFLMGALCSGLYFRDNKRDVIKMDSKLSRHKTVFEAELAAVAWAFDYAAEINWNNIYWSLDATAVVKEIISKEDPKCWSTRYTLLQVRTLLARYN